jgi:hypothetical protein
MPRPFQETLHHLSNGTLLSEASDALAALVLAVDATGKPGKLTIEISLRKLNSAAMAASSKLTLKSPQEPDVETLFFPTPEGNLLTEDPRQGKLPLKAISVPSAADLTKEA